MRERGVAEWRTLSVRVTTYALFVFPIERGQKGKWGSLSSRERLARLEAVHVEDGNGEGVRRAAGYYV
jgi:hypothetical protein